MSDYDSLDSITDSENMRSDNKEEISDEDDISSNELETHSCKDMGLR